MLLPQSRLRFRLGYSRNVSEGPGLESYDSGVLPQFTTAYRTTENAYRAGVDFRFLPKTTLSYDQYLAYDKQDNITTDNNLSYLLPGSVPVDLGIVWNTAGSTPCASSVPDDHAEFRQAHLQRNHLLFADGPAAPDIYATETIQLPVHLLQEPRNVGLTWAIAPATTGSRISTKCSPGADHSNRHARQAPQADRRWPSGFR